MLMVLFFSRGRGWLQALHDEAQGAIELAITVILIPFRRAGRQHHGEAVNFGNSEVGSNEASTLGACNRNGADPLHASAQYSDCLATFGAMLDGYGVGQRCVIRAALAHLPDHQEKGVRPVVMFVRYCCDILDATFHDGKSERVSIGKVPVERSTADGSLRSDRIERHGISVPCEYRSRRRDNPLTPIFGISAHTQLQSSIRTLLSVIDPVARNQLYRRRATLGTSLQRSLAQCLDRKRAATA